MQDAEAFGTGFQASGAGYPVPDRARRRRPDIEDRAGETAYRKARTSGLHLFHITPVTSLLRHFVNDPCSCGRGLDKDRDVA